VFVITLSFIHLRKTDSQLFDSYQDYLTIFTKELQESTFAPIEKIVNGVEPLLLLQRNLPPEALKEELYKEEKNNASLDRIWIMRDDGSLLFPYDVSDRLIADHDWWKQFQSTMSDEQRKRYQPNSTGYLLYPAFRDEMNLSTFIPVVIRETDEDGRTSFAFAEFNLTAILNQFMNQYSLNLLDTNEQIEVIILDSSGQALETTKNIPQKTVEMPAFYGNPQKEDVDRIRFRDTLLFSNEKYISFYSKSSWFNLTFCSRIPINNLVRQSRTNFLFILFISILFIVTFSILFRITVNGQRRIMKLESMQSELRFQALQAKMNPHFLFNILDTLVSEVEMGEKEKTLSMIKALSYLLHVDLRETRNEIPVEEELRYIRYYIYLQELRYKDHFAFILDIDPSVPMETKILRYCIQPLVENCFVHGIYLRTIPLITITVNLFCKEGILHVTVSDDGPGCTDEEMKDLQTSLNAKSGEEEQSQNKRKRIGLRNIRQRLELTYGAPYGVHFLSQTKGFGVELLLPLQTQVTKDENDKKVDTKDLLSLV
jgi:hypothetical protein